MCVSFHRPLLIWKDWVGSFFCEKFSAPSRCLWLLVRTARIEVIDFGLYIVKQEVSVFINEISEDEHKIEFRANHGVKCRNKNRMKF